MKKYGNTKYLISEKGYVINEKTGRKLKPQNNGNGYQKVTLTIQGIQIQRYVHRLVAEAFIPNQKNKPQVNHIDGNKLNNHVANLEWITNSENQLHAHQNGLKPNGNSLWNGKFSENDIRRMRTLDNMGRKRKDLAETFKCSKSTVSDICNFKRYKHIQ